MNIDSKQYRHIAFALDAQLNSVKIVHGDFM